MAADETTTGWTQTPFDRTMTAMEDPEPCERPQELQLLGALVDDEVVSRSVAVFSHCQDSLRWVWSNRRFRGELTDETGDLMLLLASNPYTPGDTLEQLRREYAPADASPARRGYPIDVALAHNPSATTATLRRLTANHGDHRYSRTRRARRLRYRPACLDPRAERCDVLEVLGTHPRPTELTSPFIRHLAVRIKPFLALVDPYQNANLIEEMAGCVGQPLELDPPLVSLRKHPEYCDLSTVARRLLALDVESRETAISLFHCGFEGVMSKWLNLSVLIAHHDPDRFR